MSYNNFSGKNNTYALDSSSTPPPPPPPKKSRRTLAVVAIIVIAVIVIGVGAYLATRGGTPSPSPSTTPTPTPIPGTTNTPTTTSGATQTPKPTTAPSSTSVPISAASSYAYNVTVREPNGTLSATLFVAAKNLNTNTASFREVLTTPESGTSDFIVNGVQQKAWVYDSESGNWTDISAEYQAYLSSVTATASAYINWLAAYSSATGGSYTYTVPAGNSEAGATATFTNIQINTSLPDSLFQPPT